MQQPSLVLGSQSPRRKELLAALVGEEQQVEVVPPLDPNEPGFDGLTDWDAITEQLRLIATEKFCDVTKQVAGRDNSPIVVCADTVIVGQSTAEQGESGQVVLGKPPEGDWKPVVKKWFHDYYFGQDHFAATAVCIGQRDKEPIVEIAKSTIRFRSDAVELVDWYLDTGEPLGKAGGYAIQGAGSIFVQTIQGSLSNIVGLPLETVRPMLSQFDGS